MEFNLNKKIALVTGGSRGIGQGIVEGLAAEGCRVVTCARNGEALKTAVAEMQEKGFDVTGIVTDITEKGAADVLVERTVADFGRVDVLVNNVGGNCRGEFDALSDENWEELLNLNLTSHIRVSRAVVKEMKKQGSGSIIFISSIFGREAGGKGLSIYNTTKSAMISMAKIMAIELAGQGIRVNSVAPGSIRFPGGSWDKRCIEDPEGMAKFTEANLPLGRFGSREEVANMVTFLASEKASLVTGTCINVDGCQSKSLI
ncbi:MAG: SDR family NAD(P)-dependent oxidoreductase [Calditrichaeota bacterium]|nr:MAG: SDR family NAD(P)-dependent oxidoreductase [Calditrichota bacterium]